MTDTINSHEVYMKGIDHSYYYEGYTAVEIGRLLGKNVNTVYTLLTRSRQKLKEMLEGGDHP